jgi:hypothetical protein
MPNFGSCHIPCAGGRQCVCDNRQHHYHCCRHTDCICRKSYPPIPDPLPPPRKAAPMPVGGHIDLFALLKRVRETSKEGKRYANSHA